MNLVTELNTEVQAKHGLTLQHMLNLHKLAEGLVSQEFTYGFDMRHYRYDPKWAGYDGSEYCSYNEMTLQKVAQDHNCGTAACALGSGPSIPGLEIPPNCYDWSDYSEMLFGLEPLGHHDDAWEFMFGANWAAVDNTKLGAAARILFFLAHGLPAAKHEHFFANDVSMPRRGANAVYANYLHAIEQTIARSKGENA